MSVPNSLLALLAEGPRYGAQLKSDFEARTGGTWPLNVGQVYTTLNRLERDGLVAADGPPDDEGKIRYRLTEEGVAAAASWWSTPVARQPAPRSELAIKLAMAVTSPGVDVTSVVQVQRRAALTYLQDLTRLKRAPARDDNDLAWYLVLEHLIFTTESEVRWLDHVEATLARARARLASSASAPSDSPTSESAPSTRPSAQLVQEQR